MNVQPETTVISTGQEALGLSPLGESVVVDDLVNFLPAILWTARADGITDYSSSKWGKYTGEDFAALREGSWRGAIHPDDLPHSTQVWQESVHNVTPYQDKFRLRRRDGTYHWFLSRATPKLDQAGSAIKWYGVSLDINDLREVEERLDESEQKLRLTLEAAEVGGWEWDLSTGAMKWYGNMHQLFNLPIDAFDGNYNSFLNLIHPDDRSSVSLAASRSIETGADYRTEFRVLDSKNSLRWITAKGQVHFGGQDVPSRMMGIAYDITPRKEIEDARKRMLEREQSARLAAETTAQAKDEFLAIISHELRTPLSAMLGWAQILKTRRPGDPIYERALETIERNAKHQNQLIEDLLDTSRIMSGKLKLEVQPLYLGPLVEESLDVVRPAAEARNIALQAQLDPLPSLVMGDPNRLQQVVWNLLSNAIKFTPDGGSVSVQVGLEGNSITLTVRDTGKGIKPEFLPHVFDLFQQEDQTSTRRQGGLGLGLALAKKLVEMHGGTIKAESEGEGQGASFMVILPTKTEARTTVEMKAIELKKTLDLDSRPRLDGLRILVVEDEPDARDLLVIRLQQYGAEVIAASNAAEAWDQINRSGLKPNVIVSDIAMPGEDGYSLIRRIRTLSPEEGGRIPAIALTAYSRIKDRVQALAAGFQMHVPKPVDAAELVLAISSIVGRFSRRPN